MMPAPPVGAVTSKPSMTTKEGPANTVVDTVLGPRRTTWVKPAAMPERKTPGAPRKVTVFVADAPVMGAAIVNPAYGAAFATVVKVTGPLRPNDARSAA